METGWIHNKNEILPISRVFGLWLTIRKLPVNALASDPVLMACIPLKYLATTVTHPQDSSGRSSMRLQCLYPPFTLKDDE